MIREALIGGIIDAPLAIIAVVPFAAVCVWVAANADAWH